MIVMTRVGPIGGGILAAAIYGTLQVKNERVRCLLLKLSPRTIYIKCSSSELVIILALPRADTTLLYKSVFHICKISGRHEILPGGGR